MPGRVEFTYDEKNDILLAHVHWNIHTKEDVEGWYQQWVDYMEANLPGRTVDFVVNVDDLKVDASVAKYWGEYRALINRRYGRLSYRVSMASTVRTFTMTSSVLYNISSAEAASVEAAIEGILVARQQAEKGMLGPDLQKAVANGRR